MATVKTAGTGRAFRPVECTEIAVTVKRTEKTCAEAVAKTDGRVAELSRLLEEKGFGEKALQTTDFGVTAEYENEHRGGEYARKFVGFSCRESLKLCFPFTAERLSAAVAALCGDGAEEQFHVAFTAEHGEAVKNEALEKAFADALSKALALARASGKKLGKLLTVTDGGQDGGLYSAMPAVLSARTVSVAPEDVGIFASVSAEWELE